MRIRAYTPTLVSRPAKMAVTGARAVGYESGSQLNSGKIAALMPNTTKNSAASARAEVVGERVPSFSATAAAMFTVPVAA